MMRKYRALTSALSKRHRSASTMLNEAAIARKDEAEPVKFQGENANANDLRVARDYDEVPGPKAVPILGNSWRFLPFIGAYTNKMVYYMLKIESINRLT